MARRAITLIRYQNSLPRVFQAASNGLAPGTWWLSRSLRRTLTSFVQKEPQSQFANITAAPILYLPESCPGCGAYTHVIDHDKPGYYDIHRKSVKLYLQQFGTISQEPLNESRIFEEAADIANGSLRSQLGLPDRQNDRVQGTPKPMCNRCHHLTHNSTGSPVIHPSLQSLQDIISESPYKYNHIYHVLDAADFPLSLIASIQRRLALNPQRSQNRRALASQYRHGRVMEMSFIVTRSDLLAPRKEQVDRLMPYLTQVLRDALGGVAEHVRLGNIRCVSAKRGWWTSELKEQIFARGGGGWMVGKVNVGKSNLFENVFPKGRSDSVNFASLRAAAEQGHPDPELLSQKKTSDEAAAHGPKRTAVGLGIQQSGIGSLLPPAPAEVPYPRLPLVSPLPGTTASPIRLPFGAGKGELIDLPGLDRGGLDECVLDKHKKDLVMQSRPKPRQLSIRPGHSLLVGGVVRITPLTNDLTFLAFPFVPLESHVTSTARAIAIQTQQESCGVSVIAKPGVGSRIALAGKFSMKWDVTKQRAGPLTRKDAAGIRPDRLPFIIYSIDVLVEGCGWIELTAQVRRKDFETAGENESIFDSKPYPELEIASPEGRHVGVRRPMNGWLYSGNKPGSSRATIRPRRSMKGVKKMYKLASERDK